MVASLPALANARHCLPCRQLGAPPWPDDAAEPPGLYAALLLTGAPAPPGAVRWLLDARNLDGGWGRTLVGGSCPVATALVYAALRVHGLPAYSLVPARRWLRDRGGADLFGEPWLALAGVLTWAEAPVYGGPPVAGCPGCALRAPLAALVARAPPLARALRLELRVAPPIPAPDPPARACPPLVPFGPISRALLRLAR